MHANGILAEADRSREEFLAMLAHELRNPLAPIRNAVHIVRHKSSDNPELRIPLEMIDRQLAHLARLVDDLLDISRFTRGRIVLRQLPVELGAVITRVVGDSQPSAMEFGHDIKVQLPERPIVVHGDETRLIQIIDDLLDNAIKYTPAGGKIWVNVSESDQEAQLSIRDNGIGMEAESLPRIFEPFAQINQGLDRAYGGLGIGLSLALRLVEMHGGRIEARSEGLGRGSEFIVFLPTLSGSTGP